MVTDRPERVRGNAQLVLRRMNQVAVIMWLYAKGEKSMRRYEGGQKKLVKAVCNKCGRELCVENGLLKEFCFSGDAVFGYFSRRDGVSQHFDLCEDCYDEWTAQFAVAPEETEELELL